MKWALGIGAGVVVTGLLLWLLLTGADAWRKLAWPAAPDAGAVRVRFIGPDAGAK